MTKIRTTEDVDGASLEEIYSFIRDVKKQYALENDPPDEILTVYARCIAELLYREKAE